jgi:hypothetical protein
MNELENLIFVKLYNFYIREREAATKKKTVGVEKPNSQNSWYMMIAKHAKV